MAEKEVKNEGAEKNYVNPIISWSIVGGEFALAVILALIFWL